MALTPILSQPTHPPRESRPDEAAPNGGVEYAEFVAEVLRDEERERLADPGSQAEFEELLLRLGLPVAFPAGDDLPEVEDPGAEMTDGVVTDIRTRQLHRYLREMAPLQSKIVRLFWGIGCARAHTQAEVAVHVGLSQPSVSRILSDGMSELCRRFDVQLEPAA